MTTPSPFLSMFLKSFSIVLSCWFHINGMSKRKMESYLAHEFLEAESSVKVAVHWAKEVLHLLPELKHLSSNFSLLSHLVVGTPLELRTLNHSWSDICWDQETNLHPPIHCTDLTRARSRNAIQWYHWFSFDPEFWINIKSFRWWHYPILYRIQGVHLQAATCWDFHS